MGGLRNRKLDFGVTAAVLMAVLSFSAPALATPHASKIDASGCYGAFCLTVKGILVGGSTPSGNFQIVSNSRAEATFLEDDGVVLWTDKSFANMHYLLDADGSVRIMSQVSLDVASWIDGAKYCFGYVAIVRDSELLIQNVTRQDCGNGD